MIDQVFPVEHLALLIFLEAVIPLTQAMTISGLTLPFTSGAKHSPQTPLPPALPKAVRRSRSDREPSLQAPHVRRPAASAPRAQDRPSAAAYLRAAPPAPRRPQRRCSRRIASLPAGTTLRPTAPPLSPSGASSAGPELGRVGASREWFTLALQHPFSRSASQTLGCADQASPPQPETERPRRPFL